MAVDWKKLIGLYGPKHMSDAGSTGLGPDFPESAGDREKGKFRESAYPRLTQVAVSNDDGSDVGAAAASSTEELLLELKAIRLGIQLMLGTLSSGMADADLRELVVRE